MAQRAKGIALRAEGMAQRAWRREQRAERTGNWMIAESLAIALSA